MWTPRLLGTVVTINPVFGCGVCDFCAKGQTQQVRQRLGAGCATGCRRCVLRPRDGARGEPRSAARRHDPWHGALVEPLSVGYHAVMRGTPTAEDRVLVIGGGLDRTGRGTRRAACRGRGGPGERARPGSRGDRRTPRGSARPRPRSSRTRWEDDPGWCPDTRDRRGQGDRTLGTAFEVLGSDARIVLVGMASPRAEGVGVPGQRPRAAHIIGAFCYAVDEFRSTVAWLAEHPDIAPMLVERMEPLEDGERVFAELVSGRGRCPTRCSCSSPRGAGLMERVAFLQIVKPGFTADYVRAHSPEHIWPEIVRATQEAGAHNYTGFIGGPDGRLVFGYFETEDREAVMRALAADEANTRWAAKMVPMLDAGGDLSSGGMEFLTPIWRIELTDWSVRGPHGCGDRIRFRYRTGDGRGIRASRSHDLAVGHQSRGRRSSRSGAAC